MKMQNKYPYSLGPDGLSKFFILGESGKEQDMNVSEEDKKKIDKALESVVKMFEKMNGLENVPEEKMDDEEEGFLDWLENTIIPLEATSATDEETLGEINRLKKELKREIDEERKRLSDEKKKREYVSPVCKCEEKCKDYEINKIFDKKEEKDNKNCRRPILLNGEPLIVKEAPKYRTVSFEEALEEERNELEKKKNSEIFDKMILSGFDANKDEKTLFNDFIDDDGKKCYIAYPFGKFKRGKWSDNVESIHVNEDTLVIKSRVYLPSDIPDFKESISRVIRVKLPLDSDYNTVTATNDKYYGLRIKVLKKHFERREKYSVEIK